MKQILIFFLIACNPCETCDGYVKWYADWNGFLPIYRDSWDYFSSHKTESEFQIRFDSLKWEKYYYYQIHGRGSNRKKHTYESYDWFVYHKNYRTPWEYICDMLAKDPSVDPKKIESLNIRRCVNGGWHLKKINYK